MSEYSYLYYTFVSPEARTALGDSKGNENISEGFNEFLEFFAWKKTKQNDTFE